MAGAKYKVLVTTAGTGIRLGDLTKYTNKALVRVGKKPALSYVLEAYPRDTQFVITIGHYGDRVRDFINIAHPNLHVEFVEVDKFEGKGSSLGYSLLKAKDVLNCPFIYHACDTLILNADIPRPDTNWIGVYKGGDASQYASWSILNGTDLVFNDRGAVAFDYIHVGLVGIKDHEAFWHALESQYRANPLDPSLNDSRAIVAMIADKKIFDLIQFPVWHDIGDLGTLAKAREEAEDRFDNLDKADESIFLFDDKFVVKFFHDEKMLEQRVARAEVLKDFVPPIEKVSKNYYRYAYVPGEVYSRSVTPDDFRNFLEWMQGSFWRPEQEVSQEEFTKICKEFYLTKTKERVAKLLAVNGMRDEMQTINGEQVPAMKDILEHIDFDWLAKGDERRMHGDLALENILKTKDGYCLIDWRQNFGGLIKSGDVYYDLAKLAHNLVVNHDVVAANLFTIKTIDGNVTCDIMRKDNLVRCEEVLFKFLKEYDYDVEKVKTLAAIIWLNMSPLHHKPYDLFLYHFGKLNLWRAIQRSKQ